METKNNIFLFSVDLEDARENVQDGHKYKDRVVETTTLYLDWLKKNNSICTFFSVGKIAEKYPDLVKEIKNCGHEIACHTYGHVPIDKLGKAGFKLDLEKTLNALSKAGADKITGFRAPVFSLTEKTQWAYDVLNEFGFSYSSSVLPAKNPLYGWKDFGYEYKLMNGNIIEIPMTVGKFAHLSIPIAGGIYFRVLPKLFLYNEIKKCLKSNRPVLSYFHPYDADVEQERFMHSGINENKFYNRLMYYNRKNLFGRLDDLMKMDLKITSYSNYVNLYIKK